MGDLAALLTALGGLITALGASVAMVITAVKTSKTERPRAARNLAAELAKAAEDGEVTADELRQILDDDGGNEL